MKTFSLKTLIILGAVLLVSSLAFAHSRGYGGGYNMMGGNGGGYHMMNGYGGNYNMMNGGGHMWNRLSAEDQKKMQAEMDAFYDATKDLRAEYSQKRLDLEQEYAKPERDQAKIESLEKELFNLNAKLEKEQFDHMTTMRRQFADKMPGYGMYNGGCFR